MINIILVDDHKILRQGLRSLLESEPDFNVIGEAANGEEAIPLIANHKPNVVVTDLLMSPINGIELTRHIKTHFPQIKVVVLSMYGSEVYVQQALEAGAKAYVLKESGLSDLATAIREVTVDHMFLSPPISMEKIRAYEQRIKPHKVAEES